ncbi:MAG TPA: response regulator transcription factor, partial [Saprospiraceae bacterium]|nr:response regulator transcription factor [Saprospiraceae bacterium]
RGDEAYDLAQKHLPQLIILDIMMPEIDGVELCRIIRDDEKLKNSLILFLTARNEDYSQIAAFQAGADDYISKPVRINVLKFRVQALLKRLNRTVEDEESILEVGEFRIDPSKIEVKKNGEPIELVKKEFQLLQLLASKPGKVFTREEIFNKVWDRDIIVGYRTIDVHIRKLREKIGKDHIKTIKGIGYKFNF